ncbi:DUF2750 domain-containing protein [Acinetobacter rongchengensis]|uniref:DUF2750 domain-containing protein n=1 Tax=Acinetobacter rongchengensis TaxID=2419601 RepID=A0A3A8EPE1_9GAMM|nr:DUF2750 domain-containing protein [Acinetobacter rongchengensis]RKG35989.1 DUF2750 domain-containing protein [Acinetobacter rongchengensis]
MKKYIHLQPISNELFLKISILKSLMYCGVLWGLYHEGWAMKSDQNEVFFPFWLNSVQAFQYAKIHWPHYTPRKITPKDFEESLLPTLKRLNVKPALFNSSSRKFKLSTTQMHHFFFNNNIQFQAV